MTTKDYKALASELTDILSLQSTPLAISFSRQAPPCIDRYDAAMPAPTEDGRTGRVPAGCVFWIKAQDYTFTTAAEDHVNCSVGCVTHGLKTLDEIAKNADVACMLSRVRTGLPNTEMTCAIPGRQIGAVVEKLRAASQADKALASYAGEDSKRFGQYLT